MQNCWEVMVGMCFGTILISIVYMALLKWIVRPLLYLSMLFILGGFLLLGGFAWL